MKGYIMGNSTIKCPNCGADMVLRTARRGFNAGGKFWGCSNYPRCRGIVQYNGTGHRDSTDSENARPDSARPSVNSDGHSTGSAAIHSDARATSDTSRSETSNDVSLFGTDAHYGKSDILPINPMSEPLLGLDDMEVFQTIAVESEALSKLKNDELDNAAVLTGATFRVDYSEPEYELEFEQQTICALILRFLCRGRITTNSPLVEDVLKTSIGYEGCNLTNEDYGRGVLPSNIQLDYLDNCNNESGRILAGVLSGEGKSSIIQPNTYISSILPESNSIGSVRADYVIWGDRDIILELSGDDNRNTYRNSNRWINECKKWGYDVIQIPCNSSNKLKSELLESIKNQLDYQLLSGDDSNETSNSLHGEALYLQAMKIVHQIQIAITSAIYRGVFPSESNINIQLPEGVFKDSVSNLIKDVTLTDLKELFDKYCELYGIDKFFRYSAVDSNPNSNLFVGCYEPSDKERVMITDLKIKRPVQNNIPPIGQLDVENCDEEILRYFLKYAFRFDSFNEGQKEAIERLLCRKDSIILLPTGAGKSIVYQLASFIVPGKIIVVSPLTSLMQDQQENLYYKGIDCASAIYSGISAAYGELTLSNPGYTMTYLAPERLQIDSFRKNVNRLMIRSSIYAVAIDEAHCVSEWGHDFRTAYLNIGRTSRGVFCKNGRMPVIIALTGTASSAVLKDVQRELDITSSDAVITPKTFNRDELKYKVFKSPSDCKQRELSRIILEEIPKYFNSDEKAFYGSENEDSNGGIVFCPHVNGDYGVVNVERAIAGIARSSFYAGGKPKNVSGNWDERKRRIASDFKKNRTNLLVATKAFGMGIDKENVRFTVHYGIPGSIESFYQEAGRAGRDRRDSLCSIIVSDDDKARNERLLDPLTPLSEVDKVISSIDYSSNDDITRALYFHVAAFRGEDFEESRVDVILDKLFNQDGEFNEHNILIKCASGNSDDSLGNAQKALQRLLVLGIVLDYTVDYFNNEIHAVSGACDKDNIISCYENYVRGYNEGRVQIEREKLDKLFEQLDEAGNGSNRERARIASRVLIDFIYDTIEKGRRRGLREMLRVAESALDSGDQDTEMRNRIVKYFESSRTTEIKTVLESPGGGLDLIPDMIDGSENEFGEMVGGIQSPDNAAALRGQAARYLESTPDHPGLLAIRALSELLCEDYSTDAILTDFESMIRFGIERYSSSNDEIIHVMEYAIHKAYTRDESVAVKLFLLCDKYFDEEFVCDAFLKSEILYEEEKSIPMIILADKYMRRVLSKIDELKGDK